MLTIDDPLRVRSAAEHDMCRRENALASELEEPDDDGLDELDET
jgi:hypothetical protein